jgi:hypothetical protein
VPALVGRNKFSSKTRNGEKISHRRLLHPGIIAFLNLLEGISPPPIPRLPLQKSAHGAEVALVPQEIGLLLALGPEFDRVR